MKIALFTKEFSPYSTLSHALFYTVLAKELARRGHEIHVVCQAPRNEVDHINKQGVFIHPVHFYFRKGSALGRFVYNFFAFLRLCQLLRNGHVEVIDTPLGFAEAFLPSLFLKTRLVVIGHAFSEMFIGTRSYSGLSQLIALNISAVMDAFSISRAKVVVATSRSTYNHLTNLCKPNRERATLIPDSKTDFNRFKRVDSNIRHDLGVGVDTSIILFVGWLQPRKGVHLLVDAYADLVKFVPNSILILLGQDTPTAPGGTSFKDYLRKLAKERNVLEKVMFLDKPIPEDKLISLYSACDVFVLPSYVETFGYPVIEAAACERAVIATCTGVAAELKGKAPLFIVIPPGNLSELSSSLHLLFKMDKTKREHLATLNRDLVLEHFSLEKMIQGFEAIYLRVILETN